MDWSLLEVLRFLLKVCHLIILGDFVSFGDSVVTYVTVLRWCVGCFEVVLAVSEFSVLLCIGGVIELLI